MRRFLVVIFFLYLTILLQAQKGIWNGVDLSQLGYQRSMFSFTPGFVEQDPYGWNGTNYIASDKEGEFNLGHFYLNFEIPSSGVYFKMDASFLLDATVALFKKDAGIKSVVDADHKGEMLDILPTRLAFGGFLNDHIAFYAGGQWAYRGMSVRRYWQNGDYQDLLFGGNYRGIGGHLFLGWDRVLFKYSYMYDWIRRDERTYKGIGISNELSMYLAPFNGDKSAGFFVTAEHQTTKMEPFSDPDRKKPSYPEVNATYLSVRVGIFAQGLVSGTSRTVSKGVSGAYGQ